MAQSKQKHQNIHVLIMAAGSGTRLSGGIPKQYRNIHGRTVLRHTVDKFITMPGLSTIRVIINPDHSAEYQRSIAGLDLPPYVTGGKTRQKSVYNGLKTLRNLAQNDLVLIHDAARPCVSQDDILKVIQLLKEGNKAVTLASPVSDTLRRSSDMVNQEMLSRDHLYALQTPQGFHYAAILKAHEAAAQGKTGSDDTQLILETGGAVRLIPGARENIKITTQDDMTMAQKLLAQSVTQTRTGMGFDVHAFEEASEKPLILCGIKIPHSKSLKGHSDADVGLHAITDALLGAVGGGDIGDHFPPSDAAFKDMDSAVFLQKAHEIIREKGWEIGNIDLTLICETPKIGSHKAAMRARIADILDIDPGSVNIKATTTEGLGFTGREEGIAAQAIAAVFLNP